MGDQDGYRSRQTHLRLFISSTFRDLQEEREHLVRTIFPESRALCRKRGVTFTEVGKLSPEASTSVEKADIHYWIWRVTGRAGHGMRALEIYRNFAGESRMYLYQVRRDELSAGLPTIAEADDVIPA